MESARGVLGSLGFRIFISRIVELHPVSSCVISFSASNFHIIDHVNDLCERRLTAPKLCVNFVACSLRSTVPILFSRLYIKANQPPFSFLTAVIAACALVAPAAVAGKFSLSLPPSTPC